VNNNSTYKRPPQILRKKAAPLQKKVKAEESTTSEATPPERIQKVLSRGGLGSRREIERWIEEQRFTVNGEVITLGHALKSGDRLELNGRTVNWEKFTQQPTQVLIYNKPVGEVVTRNDPEKRPIIFTQLPKLPVGRWIAVGRLDINTSGLLLVTNNGELANRLMHPSTQIEREYAVRILGEVSDESIEQLRTGVELEDGLAKFDDIQFFAGEGANKWYHVVVSEGRNRLVRRLWEAQQVVVSRLMRVRYGPIMLPERVRAGDAYTLSADELAVLMEFVGLTPEKPTAESRLLAEATKNSPAKRISTYKGNKAEKPSKNNWTYKSDAEDQATPKKPGFKGKLSDSAPKRPRFNGKKSR
jgi:23S rRNA pseudouridine2605 synthase